MLQQTSFAWHAAAPRQPHTPWLQALAAARLRVERGEIGVASAAAAPLRVRPGLFMRSADLAGVFAGVFEVPAGVRADAAAGVLAARGVCNRKGWVSVQAACCLGDVFIAARTLGPPLLAAFGVLGAASATSEGSTLFRALRRQR